MRHCNICGNKFASTNFYPGRNACKDCHAAAVRANRAARLDYYRAYDTARRREPERAAMLVEYKREARRG